MTVSPPHRFGQIIGNLLESMLQPKLQAFADKRGLYLDRHGERLGIRNGRKLSWEDDFGNSHDLDFVIEKKGSIGVQGRPVAFIEAAWRRYAKHSKNKVQEIQGAILPIAQKYRRDRPFLGVILAGVFTEPSLLQLRRYDFTVAYIPYDSVMSAFDEININARFDESTPDREFHVCVKKIERLSDTKLQRLKQCLFDFNETSFCEFFIKLERKLDRHVERITVLPLFGALIYFGNIDEAIDFIFAFDSNNPALEFQKYEVRVKFSNGDEVEGLFSAKKDAQKFLEYVST